jgi:hypothetical protein
MSQELINTLFDAMGFAFYRGFSIQKIIGGYKCMDRNVSSKKELDDMIDEAIKNLGKSISNERK